MREEERLRQNSADSLNAYAKKKFDEGNAAIRAAAERTDETLDTLRRSASSGELTQQTPTELPKASVSFEGTLKKAAGIDPNESFPSVDETIRNSAGGQTITLKEAIRRASHTNQ